jgi:hypothetical protein
VNTYSPEIILRDVKGVYPSPSADAESRMIGFQEGSTDLQARRHVSQQ